MEHFSPLGGSDINNVILRQLQQDIPVATRGSSGSRHSAAGVSNTSSGTSSSSSSSSSGSSRSGSSSNMDELSIDSATNEKIKIDNKAKESSSNRKQQQQQHDRRPTGQGAQSAARAHFKIEWRQLTYYQKERSYLSRLLFAENKKHCVSDSTNTTGNSATNGASDTTGEGPRRILNSLDGCFQSGQLSAILGPSGAGKSTFLSTLFGNKQEGAFGQTKVTWFGPDGRPTQEVDARRSIKIASLPQNDHLLHHLTVYESLMFASKIKNATRPATGKSFHRQNVRRVAKMLKLGECLDTRCGKLSGGQYKRVSIGQELLSEPDVIILDEPTSGLDAMTCLTTVRTLKSIAMKHPISIILTIHQPDADVFGLFDHVYVIAQGGLAIYEGPPQEIVPTLARVNLHMPSPTYNPARFIVEHAFVFESGGPEGAQQVGAKGSAHIAPTETGTIQSEEDDDDDDDDQDEIEREKQTKGYLRRSMLSLTEVISGKEMVSKRDKKPLLNIGIQTLDGRLITSDQLARDRDRQLEQERWNLLRRLNQIQKSRHRATQELTVTARHDSPAAPFSSGSPLLSEPVSPENPCSVRSVEDDRQGESGEKFSAKSDYSSSGWSVHRGPGATATGKHPEPDTMTTNSTGVGANHSVYQQLSSPNNPPPTPSHKSPKISKSTSLALLTDTLPGLLASASRTTGRSLQTVNPPLVGLGDSHLNSSGSILSEEFVSVNFAEREQSPVVGQPDDRADEKPKRLLKRQFDKRLSAKHNCSKQRDYPVLYHALLLTHRTWLSIVRDPIFFGIQAVMHTTIPIILALIFGSAQEEGCPRVGNFDLVDFAYSDSENMIQGTVSSIRKSIGNIGIAFFEMFVLSFSINCITALVFPLDMYVLLKEYRNGWYTLRSYLFGRTLADLPVPVVLHAIGMSILYFMTGQPLSGWRYGCILVIVIIASLVAQSIGLTIGALLMKSSQSAVLTAAGVVAPLFALSGFIVRIHTLPLVARIAANGSYLYHLLNGFIILRYGFGRCQCKVEDFEQNNAHQIPSNLHTLASMWIGTYSDEYSSSHAVASSVGNSNRTNVDPNIDVVDKMMTAFKMANSYGHQIHDCDDVLPYAMLDFNLRDHDIYMCFIVLIAMLIVSRFITFAAIYYKVRSVT